MWDRLRTIVREAEHAGARSESGDHERERDTLHLVPHARPSWASASSRLRSSGDACASTAIAACHGPQLRLSATSAHGQTRPRPRSRSGTTDCEPLDAASANGDAIRAVARAPVQPGIAGTVAAKLAAERARTGSSSLSVTHSTIAGRWPRQPRRPQPWWAAGAGPSIASPSLRRTAMSPVTSSRGAARHVGVVPTRTDGTSPAP